MKYIDADRLKAEIEKQMEDVKRHSDLGEPDDLYYDGRRSILVMLRSFIDSLQQEPIEKDEETEKLIVCDIIEATIARINGGKNDEEKEENIMREKIAYLRDLGLKAK